MRNYRERLRVPASYWVLGMFTMASFATIVWAGFSMAIGYAVYVVLLGGPALALVVWGRFAVEVNGGELRAGKSVLPLARAGKVQALDEAQTTKLRGPLADPAALMLTRPYLQARGVRRGRRGQPGPAVLAGRDASPGQAGDGDRAIAPAVPAPARPPWHDRATPQGSRGGSTRCLPRRLTRGHVP